MRFALLKCAVAAVFFLVMSAGFAQDNDPIAPAQKTKPFYVGPVIGYNRVMHSADLASFAGDALCPRFENGSANGFFIGASIEFMLGEAKDSKSSIIGRILYNTFPGYMEVSGDQYPSVASYEDPNNPGQFLDTLVISSTNHVNDVTYSTLTIEAQYKLNFLDHLGVVIGPTIDLAMTRDQVQTMNLVEPLEARFKPDETATDVRYSEDGRTIFLKEGEIKESGAMRFGLKFGLQYEILMGTKTYIVPSVNYNLGLTNLTSVDDWRVSAIQIGVDVRFAL